MAEEFRASEGSVSNRKRELVIILHGIGMSRLRMAYLEICLRRAGFSTLNLAYPSLKYDIATCAGFVREKLEKYGHEDFEKIHFASHSMGCLVTLHLLTENTFINIGRSVLIAPPFQGSEVADLLHQWRLYRLLFGPAGQELTTHHRKNIGFTLPTSCEIGVIAGTRAWEYPFFLSTMNKTGLHDGLVSVNSTRIPGVKEHITIRMSHSFLLEKSASQTVHFLIYGRFRQNNERVE